ncbi:MAG: 50S ribosomal protein L10 [Christensenellaceae bacterium]|jgi:large subunit ribosomal protein L10|nr:50S ribosomal protein L10 [Christensenellaceae bacterium]
MAVKAKQTGANFTGKCGKVAEIENYLKSAKSVVFMNYRGLNTAEDTQLRAKLRKNDVVYKVYKNNLVKIALNNLGITELDNRLTGTLSVAFSNGDEVAGAKIIKDEKFKNKMSFEFGLIGNKVLGKDEVVRLATMPNRETLIAQIMSLVQSGARNLASVINAVPRNLAVVINAHANG